jgi:hypothetical protein
MLRFFPACLVNLNIEPFIFVQLVLPSWGMLGSFFPVRFIYWVDVA